MLPVVIYEPDEGDRRQILSYLNGYSDRHGQRFAVLGSTGALKEAAGCLGAESGVLLLILGVRGGAGRDAAELERLSAKANRDNYTMYWLHSPDDLYEIAGSCLRPAGFLIPPPSEEQFERIVRRICEDYENLTEAPPDMFLALQSGGTVHRLPIGRILYIEAFDKKLNIWTQRQCLTVCERLADVERRLGDRFVRCHRSYLVNYAQIERADFARMELTLAGGTSLPLSRTGKDALKRRMSRENEEDEA